MLMHPFRLQSQALSKGIKLVRRQLSSVKELLASQPYTSLVLNATGLGALKLEDVRDTNMYPTRGQTVLVAEPKTPMKRMYEFDRTYALLSHPIAPPFHARH